MNEELGSLRAVTILANDSTRRELMTAYVVAVSILYPPMYYVAVSDMRRRYPYCGFHSRRPVIFFGALIAMTIDPDNEVD